MLRRTQNLCCTAQYRQLYDRRAPGHGERGEPWLRAENGEHDDQDQQAGCRPLSSRSATPSTASTRRSKFPPPRATSSSAPPPAPRSAPRRSTPPPRRRPKAPRSSRPRWSAAMPTSPAACSTSRSPIVQHTLATVEKLAGVRSLNEAVDVQADFVRESARANVERIAQRGSIRQVRRRRRREDRSGRDLQDLRFRPAGRLNFLRNR